MIGPGAWQGGIITSLVLLVFFLFPLTFRARVHTRITRVRALCTRWFRSLQSGTDHLVRDPLIRDKQIRFTPYDLLLYVSIFRLQCTEYLWTPQNPLSQVPEKRGKKRKEKKPFQGYARLHFYYGAGHKSWVLRYLR